MTKTAITVPKKIRVRFEKIIAQQTPYFCHAKPELTGVFTVEGYQQFAFSTDGHAILAIDAERETSEHYGCVVAQSKSLGKIVPVLFGDDREVAHVTTAQKLKAWCDIAMPEKCKECRKDRTVPCMMCSGETPSLDCEDCNGTGKEICDCGKRRRGVLAGAVVNRDILFAVVDQVESQVTVYKGAELATAYRYFPDKAMDYALRLVGEGWRALLMPMRVDADELPRFEDFL